MLNKGQKQPLKKPEQFTKPNQSGQPLKNPAKGNPYKNPSREGREGGKESNW